MSSLETFLKEVSERCDGPIECSCSPVVKYRTDLPKALKMIEKLKEAIEESFDHKNTPCECNMLQNALNACDQIAGSSE